ncbi:DUF2235 domain-containing protein [Tunturiibacter gelidoferens]|uniref:DUF2235 domain-containing protein n=1 Tax=Tunturiibacter gelidiferens TaxID=3069689 RepID=A0AAU7YUQ5_9BACT
MAKNIVICCDGTGNAYGDNNSNVVKLYQTLLIDGKRQVGYYHPGVGTEGSPNSTNRLTAALSIVAGLAFGAGLLGNVSDAYRYLMDVYEQGDNVYLFGFSRGAFTARAIAGVLQMFGLLCPGNDGLIPYVVKMYARRSRKAGGMTHTFHVAEGFKATFCRPCPLHLVGVWDTVSSVGWIWDPLKLPYTGRNPDMANGRHAISIDERRCYFRNNLWGDPFDGQSIKQVWFAGVHSDIGGSYPSAEAGLSQVTLQWMLCEAISLGLLVNPNQANQILAEVTPSTEVAPNPAQRQHNSLTGFWWILEIFPHSYYDAATKKKRWRIPLGARRAIPPGSVIHETVWQKLAVDSSYRPPNLPSDWSTNPAWRNNAEPDSPFNCSSTGSRAESAEAN